MFEFVVKVCRHPVIFERFYCFLLTKTNFIINSRMDKLKLKQIKKILFHVNHITIKILGSRTVDGKRFLESKVSSILGTLT